MSCWYSIYKGETLSYQPPRELQGNASQSISCSYEVHFLYSPSYGKPNRKSYLIYPMKYDFGDQKPHPPKTVPNVYHIYIYLNYHHCNHVRISTNITGTPAIRFTQRAKPVIWGWFRSSVDRQIARLARFDPSWLALLNLGLQLERVAWWRAGYQMLEICIPYRSV